MQKILTQKINQWSDWIKQFQFDPVYGYLIDPQYQVISFNYNQLYQILKDLSELNQTGKIIEKVKNMKKINIDKQNITHKDMVILHDACSYLVHSYIKVLRDSGKQDSQILIPQNLAYPIAFSASFLKVKIGMATGIGYNWYIKNQLKNLDNMTIQDIGIRSYYSKQTQHQGLFFKVSVATSYCLCQIIKNCYQINCIIVQQPNLQDQVRVRMNNIRNFLTKIYQHNLNIQLKLNRQFFYNVLRIFVSGFQHVKFEGIQQKISSSGGAGGYDPSFQTFERAFGIKFQGQLAKIQQKLRNGMSKPNRKFIDSMAQNSLIRQYCECTQQLQQMYNQTIQGYVKYLELHGTFIKNFIIHFMPINTTRSSFGATGATMIKIVERFRFVRNQQF